MQDSQKKTEANSKQWKQTYRVFQIMALSDSGLKINMLNMLKDIKAMTKIQGAIIEKIDNFDFIKMKKI